jgi:hypothetical protein
MTTHFIHPVPGTRQIDEINLRSYTDRGNVDFRVNSRYLGSNSVKLDTKLGDRHYPLKRKGPSE